VHDLLGRRLIRALADEETVLDADVGPAAGSRDTGVGAPNRLGSGSAVV